MSGEKPPAKNYRKSKRGLTKLGKRIGRPPNYLTAEQYRQPLGRPKTAGLTTLQIIRAERSKLRPKYAEAIAAQTEAKSAADVRAPARVAKRHARLRQRLEKRKGEYTI